MASTTSIQWTKNADGTAGRTWNPVRGCSVITPGCVNCYAMKQAHRFSRKGLPFHGLTKQTSAGPQWTGVVRTVEDALLEPLSWRKPQRIFVNSMSDLFHEGVPDAFIDKVFAVMALAPRHTFQILTKRPARMLAYLTAGQMRQLNIADTAKVLSKSRRPFALPSETIFDARRVVFGQPLLIHAWPLPNVWLGVSVEDQKHADERIPLLLQTPAAVRFISAEPLLGPVDLRHLGVKVCEGYPHPARAGLDWVIVGGESGPGARPCALEWIESIVQQCQTAGVAAFCKQLGAYVVSEHRTAPKGCMSKPEALKPYHFAPNGEVWAWRAGLNDRKGGDISAFPKELGVRQFPKVRA